MNSYLQKIHLMMIEISGMPNEIIDDYWNTESIKGIICVREGKRDLADLISTGGCNVNSVYVLCDDDAKEEVLNILLDWGSDSIEQLSTSEVNKRVGLTTGRVFQVTFDDIRRLKAADVLSEAQVNNLPRN